MITLFCLLVIGLIAVGLLAHTGLSQQAQEESVLIPVRVDEVDILARIQKRQRR